MLVSILISKLDLVNIFNIYIARYSIRFWLPDQTP